MKFDTKGRELPDSKPIEVPAGFQRPPTLMEQIERCFRQVVSRNAEARGHETFDDANDFEVGDGDPTDTDTKYTDLMEDDAFSGARDLDREAAAAARAAIADAARTRGTGAHAGDSSPGAPGSDTNADTRSGDRLPDGGGPPVAKPPVGSPGRDQDRRTVP